MPADTKKKKNRNILPDILLLITTLVIFLILSEGIVRLSGIASKYGPVKGLFQKDDLLDYSMTPDFKGKFEKAEFKGVDISTNSFGLRDDDYSSKNSKDYRILALGDSFAWGAYGTELNGTYLKILESRLNKNPGKLNYQVINAGVPGYGTDQEILYLQNKGHKLTPDLVLLNFFVGNDFHDNAQSGELTVKGEYLATNKIRETPLQKLRGFLVPHSHLYRIAEKGIVSFFGSFIQSYIKDVQYASYESQLFLDPANEEMKKEFKKTEEILTQLNSFAKSNNLKLAVVIIPLNYQADENQKKIFIKNNYNSSQQYDMEQPQKIIKEWANKNNAFVIDLLPELSKSNNNGDLYWKLNGHFNVKGNQKAAEIIHDNLLNNRNLIVRNK